MLFIPQPGKPQEICGLVPEAEGPLKFPSSLGELTAGISEDARNIDSYSKHEG